MRRILPFIFSVLLCAGLSGCFSISADELLTLPAQPQDAVELQNQIKKQQTLGAQLAPPAGVQSQAIQKQDVDGDGVEETVIFYRRQGENPLYIMFYRKTTDGYEPFAVIEGEGEAIESVDYVDMNNSGVPEILVGWQAGQGVLKALDIYRLQAGQMTRLKSISNYSAYTLQDFNGDGRQELLILRKDMSALTCMIEMYGYVSEGDEIEMISEAPLSNGIGAILRFKTGLLSDRHPAAFVVSQYDAGSVVTDIFTLRDGTMRNVTRNEETGVSDATVRWYTKPVGIDINGDGIMDIPAPMELPPYDPEAENQDTQWVIQWHSFDSWGVPWVEMTTWHNYTDSWYLVLPEAWLPGLTVTRLSPSAGEKGVVFAVRGETGPPRDLMVIYSLTGDNRKELSEKEGRVPLLENTEMIVAAEILPWADGPYTIDAEELTGRIFEIQKEWITGELNLG